ncbi:MAG: shikimate dehydrogenase [Rhizobiales bacterium PAR1]|nr:MAG: shikimate dehydrogenase [Rhizobiales bacterium PAR1]
MITGHTSVIAHIGFPTETFKAPMIYNPYFEKHDIDTIVVPMGCRSEDFAAFLPAIFSLTNIRGALITMPHKVAVLGLLDAVSTTAAISGACNAVKRTEDGKLVGDMFDGEGFARGVERKGQAIKGKDILVVGSGGVGSAIAASLAARAPRSLKLFDVNLAMAEALGARLSRHYPALDVIVGSKDPDGCDIVVNATPLGMKAGDPMPMDITRIAPTAFVGEVVLKKETTAFLDAAIQRGCRVQVGLDMLFEQIPAYLEFFGFPTTTADELRAVATIRY